MFADYIRQSPYLEWFGLTSWAICWLANRRGETVYCGECNLYTAEQLARILFSEVSMDVLQMTGNDHTEQTADPLELAEIKRRWKPLSTGCRNMRTFAKKSLPGKSNPPA